MEDLEVVLAAVVSRLDGAQIPYMISGTIAANYYGVPRSTADLDLVVQLAPGDVQRIVRLFEDEFVVSSEAVREAVTHGTQFNLIHRRLIVKVDMIMRKHDDFGDEEFARRRRTMIAGTDAWMISPEDLILYKLLWSRATHSEMQWRDIRGLVAVQLGLDEVYLEQWARRIGVHDRLLEAQRE